MFKGLCTLLALVATVLPAVASEGPAEHATGRRWRAPALQAPNLTPELYEATLRAAQHSSHLQPQRRSAAEATRRPFKVHFDYSQLRPDTNATDRDYLQNKLVPSLGAVLKQFLQVRKPVVGNLRLFPTCSTSNNSTENGSPCLEYNTTCQGVFDIPNEHLAPFGNNPGGPGVDADLIIYVSNDPELACGNTTLAAAGPCLQDLETDRPTAGIINYCTFGPDNFVADLEVSVHEVFHVLGFNPDFFERPDSVFRGFRDDNGARLRGSEIAANFTERGGTVSKIILPRVMAAARAHFGCPTLNGAELEDDGGGGTAAGHWEERVFDGELMCGSSLPLPTPSARSMLTNVTLALLEDTGWYAVNYAGSTNRFGHQAGCLLPTATCQDILASSDEAAKRFFCTDDESETEPRCTADLSGIGTCVEQPTWDGCKRVQVGTDGDCIVNDGTIGGPRGPGGRCVPTLTGSSRSAICSAMSCSGPSLVLQLTAGSTEVAPFECPSGQTLETGLVSVSIKQPIQAVCPDTALMCATTGPSNNVGYLICPNDCSAQGRCQRGVCQCFLGFVGPDCSSPICMTDADCMGGTSCHWNGQCLAGDDSVQQFPITSGGLDTGRAPSPTTSSGSSPSDSSATDSTRDSSASVLACTLSLAAGLAVVLAAILL